MRHVVAGLVAGLGDRFEDHLDRLLVAFEIRREAALVADVGRLPALLEHGGERMKNFGAHPDCVGDIVGAPTGTIMYSCMSTLESACLPPLSTFIIGTGITCASGLRYR